MYKSLLLCPVRTCWYKHKHNSKSISQSASTNAYVNDVLTEHKHKHKKKAYAYVAAVLTSALNSYAYVYAYACVASEARRTIDQQFESSAIVSRFLTKQNPDQPSLAAVSPQAISSLAVTSRPQFNNETSRFTNSRPST